MRALVVGLGSIGRRHARNWAGLGLGPLAVCHRADSPQPVPLGVEANEYQDLGIALERERPDVVLVTNPTSLHVETACTAIRAGAHVLMEKPLGHTLVGVDELLETAAATQRKLMVGYNLRFHPGLARLKQLVEHNTISRILSARAEAAEHLADWHPWEDYRKSYSGRSQLGGGAVLTFSHELDALCWLLGPPRRLTAIAAHASSLEIDTEDVAEITLEFEAGSVGSVHVDYVRRPPKRSIELVGEQGVLRWDYHRNVIEHYAPSTRQWRIEEGDPTFERNQMYVDELRHFVACVRDDAKQPLIDGQQGAAILALALAALRSSSEARTIELASEDETTKGWLNSLKTRETRV
jgi:predicted dehydrogenase